MELVDAVIVLLILLVLGIVIMAVSSIFLRAPYVPTPRAVARRMINLADLQGNEVIYDLGAGDGRFLIAVKEAYPDITARGFELSPLVYLWARLRIWRSGQQVECSLKNLLHQDLSDADCIFLYLMPGIMKELQHKLDAELQPGTKVVCHAFAFPDKTPLKREPVPWISGTKNILLYEW